MLPTSSQKKAGPVDVLGQMLTWEPLVSLLAIASGWAWGFWKWFTGKSQIERLEEMRRDLKAILAIHEAAEQRERLRDLVRRIEAEPRPLTIGLRFGQPRVKTGDDSQKR